MIHRIFSAYCLLLLSCSLHASTHVLQAFEGDGFGDWKVEGTAFGLAPVPGKTQELRSAFKGYANSSLACSAHGGDAATGSLTSPEFEISESFIIFLIAGGDYKSKTSAQLVVDGKVIHEATGKPELTLRRVVWNVSALKGEKARFRIVDQETGPWGMIAVDHVLMTDSPNQKFPEESVLAVVTDIPMIASEAVPGVSIPENTALKIAADSATQQVISPTALTIDEQGRVLISETHRFREGIDDNRNRLYWFLEDMAAQTTDDRLKMYQKWQNKVPADYYTRKTEIIRLLEDTNGDGVMERSQVYANDFNEPLDGTAAGLFSYEGTLYFACIPKLWMLKDTTGDGMADERKVIEEGFGVRVSFSGHDMNGFAIGPDGRIYGTIGDRGFSLTTKEGNKFHYPDQGAVFRFEPDGTGFELMHIGLRNPKEIAFDAYGNAFTVDNNSDQGDAARVVYLVEGGDSGWVMGHQTMHSFHRQIGLETRPPNRWMDEQMWQMRNDGQPARILPPVGLVSSGPSGLTVHPGAGFLENEAGRFLICDYRGGAAQSGILSFEMRPDGAGMKLADSRHLLAGVAATDVEYSWDGRLFITDFIGGWKSHEDGRLLELKAKGDMWRAEEAKQTAEIVSKGFDHRDSAELAMLLKHLDARVRLRAQIALTRKPDALLRFTAATTSADPLERLHGAWGLGILARRGSPVPSPASDTTAKSDSQLRENATSALTKLLSHTDPEVRAQACRALADSPANGDELQLGKALTDVSLRVRFFAAYAIGKLKAGTHYEALCEMIRENDNRDLHLRHAGAHALELLAPEKLAALANDKSPALRLAAVIALQRLQSADIAAFINDPEPIVEDEVIRAICDLDMKEFRPLVAAKLDSLDVKRWSPFMMRRLIHNAFRTGGKANAVRLIKILSNNDIPEAVRKEASRLLAEWENPNPVDQFTGEWCPLETRDPEQIRPALDAALPALLGQNGLVLTAALELIDHYHLDISYLDETVLKNLVANQELPAGARFKSLELLVQRDGSDLDTILQNNASDMQNEVALAAMAALAKRSPDLALPLLTKALGSEDIARSQLVWSILAGIPGDKSAAVFIEYLAALRETKGVSPSALELMEAARSRKEPAVVKALTDLEKALAENTDPLAKWLPALEGGNPSVGASLFVSHPAGQCLRCHSAEDGHTSGGDAGPGLAGIGKQKDARYFLESMVLPSAVVAPGYGLISITFKNGASIGGNLISESKTHLDVEVEGKILRVTRSDIASLTTPISSMPPMADLLSQAELRDLVAWLGTLKKGDSKSKKPSAPIPLDPATLAVPNKTETTATGVDPAFKKIGQQQFIICAACHGQNGEGTPAGPPLAGSEWVNGPAENLIRIQLRGLNGPIKVKGVEYNLVMAPMAYQTDEQIAAVLTHVRSNYGNNAPPVTPEQVKAQRGEVGKPMLTQDELKPVH